MIAGIQASPYAGLITEVVCGCAPGVDTLGHEYGEQIGVPVKHFPADWERYGRSAGFNRNAEMAVYGECLLAIWDGQSRGTRNMVECMRRLRKPYYVHLVKVPGIALPLLTRRIEGM